MTVARIACAALSCVTCYRVLRVKKHEKLENPKCGLQIHSVASVGRDMKILGMKSEVMLTPHNEDMSVVQA